MDDDLLRSVERFEFLVKVFPFHSGPAVGGRPQFDRIRGDLEVFDTVSESDHDAGSE